MNNSYSKLRLILGDQLNYNHSWFQAKEDNTLYVLMEVMEEATYVKHHIQKIVGFFVAMRSFAKHLSQTGHKVHYLKLDNEENRQSVVKNIIWLIDTLSITHFEYQLPDEYRLDQQLKSLSDQLPISVTNIDTEHFLSNRDDIKKLFEGKKQYLMETFYRTMRKKYQILMEVDGKSPIGGSWNYDQKNRKKLPKKHLLPNPFHFEKDVSHIVELLNRRGVGTIGKINPTHFNWPTNREEALAVLDHFLKVRLHYFGTFQDAMTDKHYLLYHSRLSFALNIKLLHPMEVVKAVENYWHDHQDSIDIAQAEGFIRQILGWREYMRGIYWAKMPDFASLNYFNHQGDLPKWFWTGDTKMKCLQHTISQSLEHAYAHHIQRLMVTGNFALLLGVHPDEVDQWYLGIYMDAIEWVEITNTRGMSQYADGGIVGTKPYVSSANYINKMSDYCTNCHYNKKEKIGDKACPFNSLYWDFYERHRNKLGNNPRIGMMYRVWDRNAPEQKEQILKQAAFHKGNINNL